MVNKRQKAVATAASAAAKHRSGAVAWSGVVRPIAARQRASAKGTKTGGARETAGRTGSGQGGEEGRVRAWRVERLLTLLRVCVCAFACAFAQWGNTPKAVAEGYGQTAAVIALLAEFERR